MQAKIGVVERNIEVVEAEIGHVKAALNGGDAFLGLDGKSEEGTAELLKRLTALETKEGQLREKELLLLKSSQLAVAAPGEQKLVKLRLYSSDFTASSVPFSFSLGLEAKFLRLGLHPLLTPML